MHLDGALRVANVGNFVLASLRLDGLNIRNVIILHVCPREVPVVGSGASDWLECFMTLAVVCAAIISNPNIVALISEQHMERFLVASTCNPRCSVLCSTMLAVDAALGSLGLSRDEESRQDVAIRRGDFISFRIAVAVPSHFVPHARIIGSAHLCEY